MQHTVKAVGAGQMGSRGIANIAHGAACSGRGKSLSMLFVALSRAAEQCVVDFQAQSLANTAWAFAMVRYW